MWQLMLALMKPSALPGVVACAWKCYPRCAGTENNASTRRDRISQSAVALRGCLKLHMFTCRGRLPCGLPLCCQSDLGDATA